MSRAMGDLNGYYEAGISASPDVKSHAVDDGSGPAQAITSSRSEGSVNSSASVHSYKLTASDRFVLICSDGVWECITSQEAVATVGGFATAEAMEAAEHLSRMSWDRWNTKFQGQVVDDITALVVNLLPFKNDADSGGEEEDPAVALQL